MKKYLLATFLLLQVADVGTTLNFLAEGTGVESNPVMTVAMLYLGPWWMVLKLGVAVALLPIFIAARTRYIVGMNLFYGFVVINNIML